MRTLICPFNTWYKYIEYVDDGGYGRVWTTGGTVFRGSKESLHFEKGRTVDDGGYGTVDAGGGCL